MEIQAFYILLAASVVTNILVLVVGLLAGAALTKIPYHRNSEKPERRPAVSFHPNVEAPSDGTVGSSAFSEKEIEQMAAARRAFEAEQKAFTQMLHYNVNDVYGAPSLEEIERRSKGGDS